MALVTPPPVCEALPLETGGGVICWVDLMDLIFRRMSRNEAMQFSLGFK